MRNKKRLLSIILSFVLMFCMCIGIVGCVFSPIDKEKNYDTIKDGELTYYRSKRTGEYYLGDNNSGENNPERWHITPYYNENEIIWFGIAFKEIKGVGTLKKYKGPSLYNIKEVSLPYCMQLIEETAITEPCSVTGMKWPAKITLVNNEGSNAVMRLSAIEYDDYEDEGYIREIFVSAYSYDERVSQLKSYYKRYLGDTKVNDRHDKREVKVYEYSNGKTHCISTWDGVIEYNFKICKANTSYLFNYEDCPNDGYFFINDFECGKTIENAPYEPLRAGYTFGGWYKESECINAWNFETDTLPQAQYNEDGQELYQETKLYAKWIKK